VPLSFVHEKTRPYEDGLVTGGATDTEDEFLTAVSRLFLDNIDRIQTSLVKYGDRKGLKMLICGADDFMGTILSEEITKFAGVDYGEIPTFKEYVDMITSIWRIPIEALTNYQGRRRLDPSDPPFGP
jgi:FO synthase subunit 2